MTNADRNLQDVVLEELNDSRSELNQATAASETELEAEFKRAAAERGVEPSVLREQMAKAGGIEALRDEMRLARTVDLLIASAKVLPSGMPVTVEAK